MGKLIVSYLNWAFGLADLNQWFKLTWLKSVHVGLSIALILLHKLY